MSPPLTPLMDVVCDAAKVWSPDILLQIWNIPAAEEGRLQSIYRESEMQNIFDSRPANDKANCRPLELRSSSSKNIGPSRR